MAKLGPMDGEDKLRPVDGAWPNSRGPVGGFLGKTEGFKCQLLHAR